MNKQELLKQAKTASFFCFTTANLLDVITTAILIYWWGLGFEGEGNPIAKYGMEQLGFFWMAMIKLGVLGFFVLFVSNRCRWFLAGVLGCVVLWNLYVNLTVMLYYLFL